MKLISNQNSEDVVLLLRKQDLTLAPKDYSARGAFHSLAVNMVKILESYMADDRRCSSDRKNKQIYLDLFKKVEKEATRLWISEWQTAHNTERLADLEKVP